MKTNIKNPIEAWKDLGGLAGLLTEASLLLFCFVAMNVFALIKLAAWLHEYLVEPLEDLRLKTKRES